MRHSNKPGPERGKVPQGPRGRAGFTAVELLVTIAVIGILSALSIPFFLNYLQAAQITVEAQQVRTLLNQARQLAIVQNGSVCVQVAAPTQLRYYLNGTCTGTAWTGSGTDSAGNINLPQGITVTASANPVFSYLGAALPAATYTMTNVATGSALTVSITTSGRITIP
jgi:prepilin-type N-terminal cleavage/methylation domain-containing protein